MNPSGSLQSILTELGTTLDNQLALARTGDMETVSSLSEEVDKLVGQASELIGQDQQDYTEHIHAIRQRQRAVTLAIASQEQELAQKLTKARKGKTSIKAYRDFL